MGVIHRGKIFPFVRKAIGRCTRLQGNLHIQCIHDIDILAAVLNVLRAVTSRSDRRSEGTGISRSGQSTGTRTKAAIGNEVDGIVGFPVTAVRDKIGNIILIFSSAIGQLIIEQHRVDAVSFIPRLYRGSSRTIIAEL